MAWSRDITGVDAAKKGTYRSLNGAADENIFIGRASKAGFYCFFKAWRDMQYDAVLDYEGILYRVEVKGSSNSKFNVTRGTRSGKQIKKGSSRTRVLSREDCDFVVGVDSNTGDCYIIPEDVIHIIGNKDLSYKTLKSYKEKWKLLMFAQNHLTQAQTRDGLLGMQLDELTQLATNLGITVSVDPIKVPGTRNTITDSKEKTVYMIWEEIAKQL